MNKLAIIFFFCAVIWGCGTSQQMQKEGEVVGVQGPEEAHRLQFHFTPPAKWMNDPNGMVFHKGEYHLFYQHNPDNIVWGPMHWGHAVSKDMIHWEHLPIALFPDSLGAIFSGSAVVDLKNTSGLGTTENPPMVAIFTYHLEVPEKEEMSYTQTQGLAFSVDNGRTWTKYKANPVLPNPGIRDFRDPKVMWHEEGQRWIMTLAVADHITFFSSPNLIDWKKESEFGIDIGAHGGVWECPDLFEIQVDGSQQKKWVLFVSINPGAPNGGSGTQYFVGDFKNGKFTMDQQFGSAVGTEGIWIDYGRDNYAGVTWANVPEEDGRRLFMGWLSNWDYASVVPTEKWRSAMTVARELSLVNTVNGLRIASKPVKELQSIFGASQNIANLTINDSLDVTESFPISSPSFSLELDVETENDTTSFSIELYNNLGQKMVIGYDAKSKRYFTDRTNAGRNAFSENFPGVHYGPRNAEGNKFPIKILVDVASMELFADEGKTAMTDIFFPDEVFKYFKIHTANGTVKIKSGNITELKSILQ